MSKLCPKCGQVLEDDVNKCQFCGSDIEEEKTEERDINDILETPSLEGISLDDDTVLKVPSLEEIDGAVSSDDSEKNEIVEGLAESLKQETSSDEEVPKDEEKKEETTDVAVETPLQAEKEEPSVEEAPKDEEKKEETTDVAVETSLQAEKEEPSVEEAPKDEEKIEEITDVAVETSLQAEKEESPVEEAPKEKEKEENPTDVVVEESQQQEKEEPPVEEVPKEETVETTDIATEKSDTIVPNDNILQETSVDDIINPVVDNSNLETVSTDGSNIQLDEEEKEIPEPTLPEATIGEINPDILGNAYEAEEKANNEKMETKKRLEEEEKKKREEEELARIANMEKPDLLAASPNVISNSSETTEKKEKKKVSKKSLMIVLAVVVVAIIAVAVWYFVFASNKDNNNYMDPINTYFEGYANNEAETMLSAFAPCAAASDNVIDTINNTLNSRSEYNEIEITATESRTEVVNDSDQESTNLYFEQVCGTVPEIQEYKQVFVVENMIVEKEEEFTLQPKFWMVKIDGTWYIAFIDQYSWT